MINTRNLIKQTNELLRKMELGLDEWEPNDDGYRYAYGHFFPEPCCNLTHKLRNNELRAHFKEARLLAKHIQQKERGKKLTIPIILGKDENGKLVLEDLADIPHLLIGGATGKGKTCFMYNILISQFLLSHPCYLKIIVMDASMASYGMLRDRKLVTRAYKKEEIGKTIEWVEKETERRNEMLDFHGLDNLGSYNSKVAGKDGKEIKPFVMVIFDEFQLYPLDTEKPPKPQQKKAKPKRPKEGDNEDMEPPDPPEASENKNTATKRDLYEKLVRLAGITRKVGIHLILSTQAPYASVVNGLMKSNLPGKMGFGLPTRSSTQVMFDDPKPFEKLGKPGYFAYRISDKIKYAQALFFNEYEKETLINNAEKLGLNFAIKL